MKLLLLVSFLLVACQKPMLITPPTVAPKVNIPSEDEYFKQRYYELLPYTIECVPNTRESKRKL